MNIQKKIIICLFLSISFYAHCVIALAEQFKQVGYLELCDNQHGSVTYDSLYHYFDEMIEFLQNNPAWAQKLYAAKERFIRSKDKRYYSSDFFGFYDESERMGRYQISFYYSFHFHAFLTQYYRECNNVPEIMGFMEACYQIQKSSTPVFERAAADLNIEAIFSSDYGQPPILLKVVKYFPAYNPSKPHYDGTAFSLFLDSTDNESLLLSSYKSSFMISDFSCVHRTFTREENKNSMVLIPGALLTEFSIYPTPHIVMHSGEVRYATIAFALRPNFIPTKNDLSILPNFNY